MIARHWRGWTTPENAEAYERTLRERVLPAIAARGVEGHRGAHVLRRNAGDEVAFVTILWFDSMEAVRAFAGEDHERAHVPAEARALLSRFDERSAHYEVVEAPGA